jgi:hypothetical protein
MATASKIQFFAIVDQWEINPSDPNGAIRLKQPVFRDRVCYFSQYASNEGGIFRPETALFASPSKDGLFQVSPDDDHAKEKFARLSKMVVDGICAGPFDDPKQAKIEADKKRPRSALEQANARIAELEAAAKSKEKKEI